MTQQRNLLDESSERCAMALTIVREKISVWSEGKTEYYYGDANTKEITCDHRQKESEPKLTLSIWDIRRDTFEKNRKGFRYAEFVKTTRARMIEFFDVSDIDQSVKKMMSRWMASLDRVRLSLRGMFHLSAPKLSRSTKQLRDLRQSASDQRKPTIRTGGTSYP